MTYVALAEAVVLAIVVLSFVSVMRWHIRQSARREDMLVNQLCNLAGRPWQEPPSWTASEAEEEPELAYMSVPEQYEVS